MKGKKIKWTNEMIELLRQEFPVCYNKELATKLGIGLRSVIRKARELGIEKERDFLEKRRPEISQMAREAHPDHPMKGIKGWCVPNSEATRFKKGQDPHKFQQKSEGQSALKLFEKRS